MNDTDRGSIVIVDDNANNLQVLSSMLQQEGYKVRPALSGEQALRAISASPPDLVLLDIRMPGMDGYETCRRLKATPATAGIPVIFISALAESEDKLAAFAIGGVDYVSKPFQAEEVLARVRAHLQLHRLQQSLEGVVEERTSALRVTVASLEESRAAYRRMLDQTIAAIAMTIEKRDPYTAGHQVRVAHLAVAIARKLGLEPERIEGLRLGATIHDIGKIYLPAEILSRPGRLSETELALVRTHAEVGLEIIRDVEFPWPIGMMIHQHHERCDGSGYPCGLAGDEILLEARILCVADVVEAMAAHRPYRAALGIGKALTEIRTGRGTLYDAPVVDACLALFEEDHYQLPPSLAG
jgi:putative nucleotidyltransferase with HDIG domain